MSTVEELKRQFEAAQKEYEEVMAKKDKEVDELKKRYREAVNEEQTAKRRLDLTKEIEILTAWAEADKEAVASKMDAHIDDRMSWCQHVVDHSIGYPTWDVEEARKGLALWALAKSGDPTTLGRLTKNLLCARLDEKIERLKNALEFF